MKSEELYGFPSVSLEWPSVIVRCILSIFLYVCIIIIASPVSAECNTDSGAGNTVYMPDGQLISSPLRLFVNVNIKVTNPEDVKVRFHGGHATQMGSAEDTVVSPALEVIPNQLWEETLNGQKRSLCGTVILAAPSKSNLIEWYKPRRRVTAVVSWGPNSDSKAMTAHQVSIGNGPAAWGWTLLLMVSLIFLIAWLSTPILRWLRSLVSGRRTPIAGLDQELLPACLLCAEDGHLSIARVQIAVWTVAIAAMVFYYGLIRLVTPNIPEQLVALMGMSVLTGGFSYLARSASSAVVMVGNAKPALSDLLMDFSPGSPPQFSVTRAQMLLWTVVVITLFLAKSALEGELWPPPWELVALMGISQATYVAPLVPSKPPSAPVADSGQSDKKS